MTETSKIDTGNKKIVSKKGRQKVNLANINTARMIFYRDDIDFGEFVVKNYSAPAVNA